MKKLIVILLFLIGTLGFSDFDFKINNREDYCIGIGKLGYETIPEKIAPTGEQELS